ncbi:MOSC domain-containing protein [Crassaminicella profunda]|uniref:MOSC domain-containing protein n=1 Tax=Crassaminicella profunda TaxID=1286698 RepID=UPI001CA78FC4|nr:MOSC domain-containing protein [Crassaminicella profunda]QZY54039.1 MOSC domain-containing protein [Crassaminicella profunda]
MGKIVAVCISKKKGTAKINVGQAEMVENHGLKGDAHAGNWHRQVSLLSFEKIEAFKKKGALVEDGAFGENLIVEGIDLKELPIGTKLMVNNIELEVTQIGKECHSHCRIYETVGDCIMPREGIFARVLKGGMIKNGDEMKVVFTNEKN